VEDEADKLSAILRAADAEDLADCTKELSETALGCSRDLLATHKASQSLWQEYARTQCTLNGLPSLGGWAQGTEYNACFIRLAADRIDAMWFRVRFFY